LNVSNVGIVIVSHSPKVAEGAADMVYQMVGDSVRVAYTGGNGEGGLGTDAGSIIEAIDRAWSDAGVVVLVDLGGAETNSEMAIEMLAPSRRAKVALCDAPRPRHPVARCSNRCARWLRHPILINRSIPSPLTEVFHLH
jgi:dihydroxyacetone kinase phosphotransfer subunit